MKIICYCGKFHIVNISTMCYNMHIKKLDTEENDMSLWETLEKGYATLNNAAGKVNSEAQEAYERGLGMGEKQLKDYVLSATSLGRKQGYLKAYREKYGKNI